MAIQSYIDHFWHYVVANPRLSLTAGVLGLVVAICFFKPIFYDAAGFRHALSLDLRKMTGPHWHEFVWYKLRLMFWIAICAGVIVLGFYELPRQFPGFVAQPTFQTQIGVAHKFQLSKAPKFLSEEIAVGDARATFAAENFDRHKWDLIGTSRTKSPDGSNDTYFVRSYLNPNRGYVTFTNGPHSRIVDVKLDGNQIICQIVMGKE